ncbi:MULTISPECIES: hypothetical protein [unclassified Nocardioides]|uniref:hypothetical protein n=1 Tax=unclassified Nocardioides TaxID=2615069 RepID=UPI0006FED55C|nr:MULTISPECIES: hypothetical protein [unclassified Nocardioides]KQY57074.1 hypothetical protein ASD30_12495 [Nocardioides sp. Root140]KRF11714.1 hypothetical protein ASH02_17140 [Nocardioides sp. Soil796]
MSDSEDKPVVNGLVALVAVAVVVGLLAGIAAIIGTKVLGVGGGGGGSDDPAAGDSLVMPDPERTTRASDPLITLEPSDDEESESAAASETASEETTKKPRKPKAEITLSQGAFQVSPGEDLYLSGIYPQGEGAVLDVQIRVNDGAWADFPVDVNVSDATFSTYVNTSQTGEIEWRVVDSDRKLKSNAIKVTYGG